MGGSHAKAVSSCPAIRPPRSRRSVAEARLHRSLQRDVFANGMRRQFVSGVHAGDPPRHAIVPEEGHQTLVRPPGELHES
jgi:hypothetical protein